MRSPVHTEVRIMDALQARPLTAVAIAATVGLSVATVSRRLRTMQPEVRKFGTTKNPHVTGIAAALWGLA